MTSRYRDADHFRLNNSLGDLYRWLFTATIESLGVVELLRLFLQRIMQLR
ncbi:hypothetical protein ABIS04_15720 [Shewanella sp. H8]